MLSILLKRRGANCASLYKFTFTVICLICFDRIRKKYPQNLPGEESEQIEFYEETVAKDDLPNESMKTDKAMEFPLHKHANLVVNPGLTFGKKTNT
jgi:hypothetical protein